MLISESEQLLDESLARLALGRVLVLESVYGGRRELAEARKHLDAAVDGLRRVGIQEHIASGLLIRGAFFRLMSDLEGAKADLAEATRIAGQGGMRFCQVDCYLERTRLHLARGEKAKARESLNVAAGMVKELGYGRRAPYVAELEKVVGPN